MEGRKIQDPMTRFCIDAMRANGGRWDAESAAWIFTAECRMANALAKLYRVTRATSATSAQLAVLLEMIEDGTAAQAWSYIVELSTALKWVA